MDRRKGYLRLSGAGEGSVSFEGECEVTDDGRQIVIEFDESAGGMEDTRTLLVLSEDTMTLNRIGSYETVMVFANETDSPVRLGSPFGSIDMRLVTDRLEIVRGEGSVNAKVRYRFLLGGGSLENVLTLECRTSGYLEERLS